jgi:hypothetical protein
MPDDHKSTEASADSRDQGTVNLESTWRAPMTSSRRHCFRRSNELKTSNRVVLRAAAYLRQAGLNGIREKLRRKGRKPQSVELDERISGSSCR